MEPTGDSREVSGGVTRPSVSRSVHRACPRRNQVPAKVPGSNGRAKMAAEGGSGNAASAGGSRGAAAMGRVLPMLLVPVPAEAMGQLGSRAQLHTQQEALGSLTAAGSLQVLSLAPGSRGRGRCCLEGPFWQ